jgi:hypothetical protein
MNGFQLGDFLCAVTVSFALFAVIRLVIKTIIEPDHRPPFRASEDSENPT